MSFSSSEAEKEHEIEDDLESVASDASYELIESANCGQRLQSFLIRLILSLIVIGACTGALIWSFENGEAGANEVVTRDASKNFSIFVNEYSKRTGTVSITNRKPDSATNELETAQSYPSWWYQDNTNQKLVHRRDNQTTIFVYPNYAYWAVYDKWNNVQSCRYDVYTNYSTYIQRLGMTSLVREHSAYESTHNHAKVFVYDGDPSDVIFEGTRQQAFLVTAYADAYSGALLGWDTYFTASIDSNLVYEISYWYDNMILAEPDLMVFDPPEECEPRN